jgi:hypothetical protein
VAEVCTEALRRRSCHGLCRFADGKDYHATRCKYFGTDDHLRGISVEYVRNLLPRVSSLGRCGQQFTQELTVAVAPCSMRLKALVHMRLLSGAECANYAGQRIGALAGLGDICPFFDGVCAIAPWAKDDSGDTGLVKQRRLHPTK